MVKQISLIVAVTIWWLCLCIPNFGADCGRLGPKSGDAYREYVLNNHGNRAWRVTNPLARAAGAKEFLPNPVLELEIPDDLSGAVRAEVMLDRWGGHLDTLTPRIRFNENDWLDVPPPKRNEEQNLPENYYFQDNPVIPVPLEHLKPGLNRIEGTCGHVEEDGWGQWGLYSLALRVYFDPAKTEHCRGRIISPAQGESFEENPTIVLEADASRLERAEIFAWYEGYDENGDGCFADWHGGWFQPNRGLPAEWLGHVGTIRTPPLKTTWDTRWVPDQETGRIRLVARILDKSRMWFVTDEVTNLTLRRDKETVTLYRDESLPPEFGVRVGQRKSCVILLPSDYDAQSVIEVGLHYRTWHGWDKHHAPYRLNDYERPHEGNNHHYDYDVHLIPPNVLKPGENIFTIYSQTEHHMLEVLWPGPALTIRRKK
ncbi:MAG: hypothetical protein ACUVWX_10805 [Kiritimatiellia bacterium]